MLVPVRAATLPPLVKIGINVTELVMYSVFVSSTSVDCGTSWSVLEAMVVTTPFSVRRMEDPLIEYTTVLVLGP
jgi:hypothetical protein